jgi:signal transduction histidine kinase
MQLALETPRSRSVARSVTTSWPVARRAFPVGTSLVLLLLLIGAAALWDERHQAASALESFGAEQATLARNATALLSARLETIDARARALAAEGPLPSRDSDGLQVLTGETTVSDAAHIGRTVSLPGGARVTAVIPLASLVSALGPLEQPRDVRVLVHFSGRPGLVSTSGEQLRAPALETALATRAPWWQVEPLVASALGLPSRLAMAGSSLLDVGDARPWNVAVVSTAFHERDRAARGALRLVLGFSLAVALVSLVFALVRRARRQELELTRQLALAEAARLRDEKLVRADKLATLGVLGASMEREISAPLGLIVALSEQLLPQLAHQPGHHAVLTILEQAARLGQVTRTFMGLAHGGTEARALVKPAALARSAVDLVQHRFARSGVRLTLRADESLPQIACEPDLLEQALVNLLLNACEACERGGQVELLVSGDFSQVGFAVLDDGRAIDPADAEAGVEALRPDFGLAIARAIVKLHHGEFTINPHKSGLGTRAVIELDAALASTARVPALQGA